MVRGLLSSCGAQVFSSCVTWVPEGMGSVVAAPGL